MNLNYLNKKRMLFTLFLAFSLFYILYYEFNPVLQEGFKIKKPKPLKMPKMPNISNVIKDVGKGVTNIARDVGKGASDLASDVGKGALNVIDDAGDFFKSLDFSQLTNLVGYIEKLFKDLEDISKSVTSLLNKLDN